MEADGGSLNDSWISGLFHGRSPIQSGCEFVQLLKPPVIQLLEKMKQRRNKARSQGRRVLQERILAARRAAATFDASNIPAERKRVSYLVAQGKRSVRT